MPPRPDRIPKLARPSWTSRLDYESERSRSIQENAVHRNLEQTLAPSPPPSPSQLIAWIPQIPQPTNAAQQQVVSSENSSLKSSAPDPSDSRPQLSPPTSPAHQQDVSSKTSSSKPSAPVPDKPQPNGQSQFSSTVAAKVQRDVTPGSHLPSKRSSAVPANVKTNGGEPCRRPAKRTKTIDTSKDKPPQAAPAPSYRYIDKHGNVQFTTMAEIQKPDETPYTLPRNQREFRKALLMMTPAEVRALGDECRYAGRVHEHIKRSRPIEEAGHSPNWPGRITDFNAVGMPPGDQKEVEKNEEPFVNLDEDDTRDLFFLFKTYEGLNGKPMPMA